MKIGDIEYLYCRACRYPSEHEVTQIVTPENEDDEPMIIYTCNDCGEDR